MPRIKDKLVILLYSGLDMHYAAYHLATDANIHFL